MITWITPLSLRRVRRVVGAVLLVLLQGASAWAVEISRAEIAGQPLTVCRVNVLQEHLELFLRDDEGQTIKRFNRLASLVRQRGKTLVFAMNAGMFHADYSPVGLFIAGGQQLAALNTGDAPGNFFLKPNGVFLITKEGARIVATTEYAKISEPVLLATQSGPMLVHQGQIHPAFNAASDSRLFRNGVCAPPPEIAIFVNSEHR